MASKHDISHSLTEVFGDEIVTAKYLYRTFTIGESERKIATRKGRICGLTKLPLDRLAIVLNSGVVEIWNVKNKSHVVTIGILDRIFVCSLVLCGDDLAALLCFNRVVIWDHSRLETVSIIDEDVSSLTSLPNGLIVTGSVNGIKIWEPLTGKLVRSSEEKFYVDEILSAFGSLIVVCRRGVEIWNSDTVERKEILWKSGNEKYVEKLALLPNGNFSYTCGLGTRRRSPEGSLISPSFLV